MNSSLHTLQCIIVCASPFSPRLSKDITSFHGEQLNGNWYCGHQTVPNIKHKTPAYQSDPSLQDYGPRVLNREDPYREIHTSEQVWERRFEPGGEGKPNGIGWSRGGYLMAGCLGEERM